MNYLKEIAGKNKIWIYIYISLGIGLSFLSNYNISFFQKLIDKFTDGTLSLPVILVYGGLLLLLCLGNYLDEYPMQKLNNRKADTKSGERSHGGKKYTVPVLVSNCTGTASFRFVQPVFYLPPEPCDRLYSSLRLFTGFSYYQFIAEASVPDERKSSG